MTGDRLPLDGLVPKRPPAELRAQVLAAAHAAARSETGLLPALYRDAVLRWCFAIVLALALANAWAGGGAQAVAISRPPAAAYGDENPPAPPSVPLAAQLGGLASELGLEIRG